MILLILFSCSSHRDDKKKPEKRVGIAQKTANPNIPYIYINGFLNYIIEKTQVVLKNDTINLNELKFNAVGSAFYTKMVMYNKFGKWTKQVRSNDENHPILLWENVKLFENEDKLFTIYANGDENWKEIYASVLISDDEENDCLKEENLYKNRIIDYFSNSIKNLNNKKDFSNVYGNR